LLPKKWVVGVTATLLVILLLTGYLAVASEFGSKNDPLVTLSYIEELVPELKNTIDKAIQDKSSEFDEILNKKVDQALDSIDGRIAEFENDYSADIVDNSFINAVADKVYEKIQASGSSGSVSDGTSASLFSVVRIKSGQTVIGEVGTEILWRFGTATCTAPGTPGLIDVSTGSDLPNGSSLQTNHLYVVTVENRGFKTTSDCVILIKGPYIVQ
jgi:hypothetical protein